MPAYNEEATIAGVIAGIHDALKGEDYKIAVVADGCRDRTLEYARRAGALVYSKEHKGLADAFRFEMVKALEFNPDYIVHIDSDGQYNPYEIPSMLEVAEKVDLVLGNRLWHHPLKMPMSKYAFNRLGAFGYSLLLRRAIPDMTTGFRAFNPSIAKLPIISNYTYTQEQVFRASKAGYRIASIPVAFSPRGDKSRLMSGVGHYLARSVVDFTRFGRVF
jgi:glycosyltransferase involved in cell wall biosynthesis